MANIIMSELRADLLEEFARTHNIGPHAVLCVSEKCIEVYDEDFKHFIDGKWHDGKMPEFKKLSEQTANTGRLFGRYITKKRGVWYNKSIIIT